MHKKQKLLIRMLNGGKVLVLVDPRKKGVLVPDFCYESLPLGLTLGTNLPIPIPDLKLSNEGFTATLSFHRKACKVSIPWEAVFGMVNDDNEGPLWVNDIPLELIDEFPLNLIPEEDVPQSTDSWTMERDKKPILGIIDGDKKDGVPKEKTDHPKLSIVRDTPNS